MLCNCGLHRRPWDGKHHYIAKSYRIGNPSGCQIAAKLMYKRLHFRPLRVAHAEHYLVARL